MFVHSSSKPNKVRVTSLLSRSPALVQDSHLYFNVSGSTAEVSCNTQSIQTETTTLIYRAPLMFPLYKVLNKIISERPPKDYIALLLSLFKRIKALLDKLPIAMLLHMPLSAALLYASQV